MWTLLDCEAGGAGQLLPTPEQAAALGVSQVAFETDTKRNFALRELAYEQVKRRWGLGAQAAQHVIKKTCDAYATLRANLRAGNLGRPGSKRHRRASEKAIAFRPQGAQPYDDRMLSWQTAERTVSIWTTGGRMKNVAFTASPEQLDTLALYRKGESDLLARDGMWFLNAKREVPQQAAEHRPGGLPRHRSGDRDTPSANRRLNKRRRKETRRARDINHKIAKHVVAEAERTGRGIALEDLTGHPLQLGVRPARSFHRV
jgi:hypothetical protein